jgi:hypothetical protein
MTQSIDRNNGALFEDDYLLRTLGPIAHDPQTALAELVANAWDAGASSVKVVIPSEVGGTLTVEDDGHGMTAEQFRSRWMKLSYDRSKTQGDNVEFPPERADWTRKAFGRNGVGRHGLLCFSDRYRVQTRRDGIQSNFVIGTRNHTSPFFIESEKQVQAKGHGTRLLVEVEHHFPDEDEIRTVLSARFLHDPRFVVEVNGVSVPLSEHRGLIETQALTISDGRQATAHVVDATSSGRSTRYQGIAFWVNNRLVGLPSWHVGTSLVIDGRSRFAKRHAIVIQAGEAWMPEIEADWSRFKPTPAVKELFRAVIAYAQAVFDKLSADFIDEQSEDALMRNRESYRRLPTGAKLEVARFTQDLVHEQPGIAPEALSQAVKVVIKLQQARSGSSLLERLLALDEHDIQSLDRMLEQWSVQDALTVLDEIDTRISVIAAIEKLCGEDSTDELHTLHPLVTKARWLFGPEFDSPEFASNNTLRNVARRLFKSKLADLTFAHPSKRPDLVILKDATVSLVGTEAFDSHGDCLATVRDVLLIELKKGNSTIGRDEIGQATAYVEDLIADAGIAGKPFFYAFVVGHNVAHGVTKNRELKDDDGRSRGKVVATTFSQLTDTANRRLHGLRQRIPARYDDASGFTLMQKVMATESQADLLPRRTSDVPPQVA